MEPGGSVGKSLPAMQETWVQSLFWEDPREKGMATTPGFAPRQFHEQKSLACCSPWGYKELDTTERLTLPLPQSKEHADGLELRYEGEE